MAVLHETPEYQRIPDFPYLLARRRRGEGDLTLADDRAGVEITIRGPAGDISALERVLDRCDGTCSLDVIVDGATPDTVKALAGLADADVLVDGRAYPRRLLAELMRSPPLAPDALQEIVSRKRWYDHRLNAPRNGGGWPSRGERPAQLTRFSSFPLDFGVDETEPVSQTDLATLLDWAYGTDGRWKPIASAGRLWPTVIHAVTPCDAGCELSWFDDRDRTLYRVARLRSHPSVASVFLQRAFVQRALEAGAALVILSCDLARSGTKYGNRGALYAALEVGALNQQLTLSAGLLELRCRPLGGFYVSRLRDLLEIDIDPILCLVVAKPLG